MSAADLCLALALSALLSVVVAAAQYMRAEKAEAEVARLTAERDAAIERLERVIDQWRKTGRAVISEMNRADNAEAERDALAAAHARESEKVWKVEEVMDDIEGSDPTTWERLRDALAGSEADTSGAQPTDQEDHE